MKVRKLIALLQKEENQDAEVRFSESYISPIAMPGERLSCGPEEGSPIFGITTEGAYYGDDKEWEEHVVLLGEVLANIPGTHFPPTEDENGGQTASKEVLDLAVIERERRAVFFARKPAEDPESKVAATKAHRQKYRDLFRALDAAKKKDAGLIIIAAPWVLGDSYEEMLVNMNIIAGAGLHLRIGKLDFETREDAQLFPKFKN